MRAGIFKSCVAGVIFISFPIAAQRTIDATEPSSPRLIEPTIRHVGSVGRKLPLEITMKPMWPSSHPKGESTVVDFTFKNTGTDVIMLPVSPRPEGIEPGSPTIVRLSLFLTTDKAQVSIVQPATYLLGSKSVAGTLTALAGGESLHVLISVALKDIDSGKDSNAFVFIAHASLAEEAMKTVAGTAVVDSIEIGSAASQPYDSQVFLK